LHSDMTPEEADRVLAAFTQLSADAFDRSVRL
jgi:hypothetical protein